MREAKWLYAASSAVLGRDFFEDCFAAGATTSALCSGRAGLLGFRNGLAWGAASPSFRTE